VKCGGNKWAAAIGSGLNEQFSSECTDGCHTTHCGSVTISDEKGNFVARIKGFKICQSTEDSQ
jgi:hypothetical protein